MFFYVLLAIIILLVMIVIHELGHYTAGKILKFKIDEFSVGFGPKLLQKTNKKSGEKFTLRLIPLGGYCAFSSDYNEEMLEKTDKAISPFEGDLPADNTDSDTLDVPDVTSTEKNQNRAKGFLHGMASEGKAFESEKPWKRIIVLVAGAGFNFVSAIIFSFICILAVGFYVPEVNDIMTDGNGTPYNAELQKNDIIMAVDGKEISIMNTFDEMMAAYDAGDTVNLTVKRDGEIKIITVKKKVISDKDEDGNTYTYEGYGFKRNNVAIKAGVGNSLKYCVPYTGKLSWQIIGSFGQLITGKVPITDVTGPVGTIGMIADYSSRDWTFILMLLPLIASNLAIFNLLPIPALDGAKIIFTAIEWVRGKPVKRKVEEMIHGIGMIVLLAFVVIIDIIGFVLRAV